ncbi:S-layer homology domain-containing protein [Patescibacteria group bacterium]|nr:S-layer homology domain-containing protein [Patescibacteria group bacterium]MBU1703427.1 S-layer homology domain-containing protein [Patescibacteria group bacterium]MBU1953634.1 S-layer homology domain-containing protein [Patescibacteria group bacterium]
MKKTLFTVAISIVLSLCATFAVLAYVSPTQGVDVPYPFSDVNENDYYATAIGYLNEVGVINGYENGDFGPNDTVTRGQVAAMLYRYDQSLVKPEFNVSGISDLIVLVCGIDKANFSDSNYPGAASAYDEICGKLP